MSKSSQESLVNPYIPIQFPPNVQFPRHGFQANTSQITPISNLGEITSNTPTPLQSRRGSVLDFMGNQKALKKSSVQPPMIPASSSPTTPISIAPISISNNSNSINNSNKINNSHENRLKVLSFSENEKKEDWFDGNNSQPKAWCFKHKQFVHYLRGSEKKIIKGKRAFLIGLCALDGETHISRILPNK